MYVSPLSKRSAYIVLIFRLLLIDFLVGQGYIGRELVFTDAEWDLLRCSKLNTNTILNKIDCNVKYIFMWSFLNIKKK